MFKLNIEKAKELHRDRIRIKREKIFKELDAKFMRALESNDTQKIAEITSLKQQLRDMPACEEVENACCLNDLREHWPDILGSDYPSNQRPLK